MSTYHHVLMPVPLSPQPPMSIILIIFPLRMGILLDIRSFRGILLVEAHGLADMMSTGADR